MKAKTYRILVPAGPKPATALLKYSYEALALKTGFIVDE
jgi:hypothetical protein